MMTIFLLILLLFFSGCISASSRITNGKGYVEGKVTIPFGCSTERKVIPEDKGEIISKYGIVYKGMPKEYLPNAGYTKHTLLSYYKQGNKEWMTFSDWTTPEYGDTITFVIINGKVERWFKEAKNEVLEWEI